MVISIKNTEVTKKSSSVSLKQPELSVIAKVIKGDTYMVMADAAKELEDEFVNLYYTSGSTNNHLAVIPPYTPKTLKGLVRTNNILNQCVQAMEVNIDGTGHEFVQTHPDVEMDKSELEQAEAFFAEPYPGKSFISQRRQLRQDLESIGYGFIEALRTIDGKVVGTRYMEAQTIRLVRLGDAVDMEYDMSRGGSDVKITIKERPRRYMQSFNGTDKQYFKEFGIPLDLNKKTGIWAEKGEKLKPEDRASELIPFGVDKDHSGPYFVPRWINQLPSVLGSRKAEEANLEFFDSGGMPPAIIFIQGGQMVGDASNQLRTYLSNGNRKKGRAVVVELMANSGSLDSAGAAVTAKVERFGADRLGDGMYDKYDTKAEEHVRVGFRLPPLFIGRSSDYNYATAVVAYQVAEAQVFQPERTEFDEIINGTIIKALGYKTLRIRSLPITMKSVEELFKGLALMGDKVEPEDFVEAVNSAIGTDLQYKKPEPPVIPPQANVDPHTNLPYDKPLPPGTALPTKEPVPEKEPAEVEDKKAAKVLEDKVAVKKEDQTITLLKLVRRTAEIEGLVEPLLELSPTEVLQVRESVQKLDDTDKLVFNQLLTSYVKPEYDHSH